MDTEKEINVGDNDIKHDQVLLNLKIISQIKKYDKLSINNDNLEIDNRIILQGVRRYYQGDGRITTIAFIEKIIDQAFGVTDKTLNKEHNKSLDLKPIKAQNNIVRSAPNNSYFNEDNSHLLQRFYHEMSNAATGLENLRETYSMDVTTVSKVDILLQKLKMRTDKISKLMKITV